MVLKRLLSALLGAGKFPAKRDLAQDGTKHQENGSGQTAASAESATDETVLQLDRIPEIAVARKKYADDAHRLEDFDEMYETAEWFLLGFNWHRALLESRIGLYCEGFYGVYLFKIEPVSEDIPEWIWIVEGGSAASPAVIPIDRCPNGAAAFHEYIAAIGEWVDAVKNGEPVDDVIPVALPPTLEEAQRMERQLRFMSKDLYPKHVEFFED